MPAAETETTDIKPKSRPFQYSLATLLLVVTVLSALLAICSLVFRGVRNEWQQWKCIDTRSKIVTMGIVNYESAHGTLPPAYLTDKNGKPMHSWRVLILPYMGYNDLYERYDFSEPWDGPNNRRLAAEMPEVYRCPDYDGDNEFATNFVAVVGEETAWPPGNSVQATDFADGRHHTILIVEVADSDIHWMEPRDMSVNQAITGVNVDRRRGISSNHSGGACVGMADSSIRFLSDDVTPEALKAALTISGAEEGYRLE